MTDTLNHRLRFITARGRYDLAAILACAHQRSRRGKGSYQGELSFALSSVWRDANGEMQIYQMRVLSRTPCSSQHFIRPGEYADTFELWAVAVKSKPHASYVHAV